MNAKNKNLIKRIVNVRRIVEDNYERGNQGKCKLQVYRQNVVDIYPMCERTFWRYMSVDICGENKAKEDDPKQLKLDF